MHSKLTLAAVVSLFALTARADDRAPRYERRWFYSMYNLQVERSADDVIALIERAAKAGYNGVVLADYKFNVLDRVPDFYFKNVARVRAAADKHKIELIPTIFPIGYSNGLLAHDPNLAEGLPVEDAPFVVKGREARLVVDRKARLANGDLEKLKGESFAGFGFQDDPGKATVADRKVVHGGKISCRMQDTARTSTNGNSRLIQKVSVRPHTGYRLSCWAKTRDLSAPGNFHLTVISAGEGGRQLTFHEGGIEPTQDWKQIDVVFNSLDSSEVNLYVGLWGGCTGALWIDDLALDELGLVNVLRRPGCPLTVRSEDGRTTYTEGKDFERVIDPKLGNDPWPGEYEFEHKGPPVCITSGARIKDGARLRVSWYHPVLTHGNQIMCCLSEPKIYELLAEQARRVNDLLHPKTVLMSHDEIRVANWCKACQDRTLSPGALLADNVKKCQEIAHKAFPGAQLAVWSDMFDPHHNAVDRYYLVNGSWSGSWEGLEPATVIANWNGGKAKESLAFFADRGHPQLIAGYYDVDDLSGFTNWDAAARGIKRIIGFCYTTWGAKYKLLEEYGKAMQGAR